MLNRETFMLTSTHLSGSLKIHSISHGKRIPTLLASLHLPELQPEYHLRAIDYHSGPVHACPPENRFFTTISVSYIGTVPEDNRSYSVFIHNDQLIGIAKSNPPGSNLVWHSWGPQHTRFLPRCSYKLAAVNFLALPLCPNTILYTRYVHGQRVICSTPEMI